eukprot:11018565-Prorocentrum_lima.AAC.1
MAQELQMTASKVPGTLAQVAMWLEGYIHKLDHGMQLCALQEPRTILAVVKETMEAVVSRDGLLTKTMIDELASLVRLMFGEVRQRTGGEKSARASRE